MNAILSFLKRYWIRFVVSVVLGGAILILFLSLQNEWTSRFGYMNGCFIAGAFLLGVAALSIINNFGGFRLASYYFRRKKTVENEGKYENFIEFNARKDEERVSFRWCFLPYVIVGLIYLIPSLVLMAIR